MASVVRIQQTLNEFGATLVFSEGRADHIAGDLNTPVGYCKKIYFGLYLAMNNGAVTAQTNYTKAMLRLYDGSDSFTLHEGMNVLEMNLKGVYQYDLIAFTGQNDIAAEPLCDSVKSEILINFIF